MFVYNNQAFKYRALWIFWQNELKINLKLTQPHSGYKNSMVGKKKPNISAGSEKNHSKQNLQKTW